MGKLELDKWDLKRLWELWKKGRINLQPEYQRGNVWDNPRRYDLLDTVFRTWPSGLIMFRAYEQEGDPEPLEYYDVVDGQQRLTTLFQYVDGSQAWALEAPPRLKADFKPYKALPPAQQVRVDEYKFSVAFMRGYDITEIQDIYSRLQTGKPLKIGEKIKAIRTDLKDYLKELAAHKLFALNRLSFRDNNWNLAAQFFKATYTSDPLARVEFPELKGFLEMNHESGISKKAQEQANRIMTYELKVLNEAIGTRPTFEENVSTARTLKWLFAVLMPLMGSHALTGKEHLVAKGLIDYYDARAKEGTKEWECYLQSGRTGRMDTDDVKACLSQLAGFILNASKADPLDQKRYFTARQREEIWTNSNRKCRMCNIPLTPTNFHADHTKPWADGGHTTVENGQVLCARCNLTKGKDVVFLATT